MPEKHSGVVTPPLTVTCRASRHLVMPHRASLVECLGSGVHQIATLPGGTNPFEHPRDLAVGPNRNAARTTRCNTSDAVAESETGCCHAEAALGDDRNTLDEPRSSLANADPFDTLLLVV